MSTSTAPTTTPVATTVPVRFATPRVFAEATFIETRESVVAVARVDDGKVVQVLKPASPPPLTQIPEAMRAPDGGLLVKAVIRNVGDAWRDTKSGAIFPGGAAHVSPDGQRIATVVFEPDREQVVRQYDVASGRVLTDLRGGVAPSVLGFCWTPDGRALVVAVPPDGPQPAGLYVVDRDAHELPSRPTAIPVPGSTFFGPAALANGHVVTFEFRWPVQRPAWPTTVVDINLRTGARRSVLDSSDTAHPLDLDLDLDNPIEARGYQALFTDGNRNTWLSDGRTARRIASGNNASHW